MWRSFVIPGFWRGQGLAFPNLRVLPLPTISAAEIPNLNQAAIDLALRNARQPLNNIARVTRAYLGWLLTNRTFLDEHDALLNHWQLMLRVGHNVAWTVDPAA